MNDYATDLLNKHPLEPADWEIAGNYCPLCGETRNESERVCAECRRDAVQLSRLLLPALAWASAEMRGCDPPGAGGRCGYDVCERCHCSDCECSVPGTVRAPDGEAQMAVAPTSIASAYRLIRSPGAATHRTASRKQSEWLEKARALPSGRRRELLAEPDGQTKTTLVDPELEYALGELRWAIDALDGTIVGVERSRHFEAVRASIVRQLERVEALVCAGKR